MSQAPCSDRGLGSPLGEQNQWLRPAGAFQAWNSSAGMGLFGDAGAIHDATGGFKCFRRRVLESIELETIDAAGYVFQIETTYRTLRKGFRVVEVPIHFADRTAGQSKMTRAIVLEAVWKVPRLRLQALRQRL